MRRGGEHQPAWLVLGIIVLGAGVASAARTLFTRIPPPQGRALLRADAPALFAVLDELRAQLRCPSFDRVLITGDLNASVTQTPRLGVLGWWHSHLSVGLPLLDSISPGEMRAVLAHELAHHSRKHGRFGAWIYRTRLAWSRLFDEWARPGAKRPWLAKVADWLWPRFNAHAFVLSRANEYEADTESARLAGAGDAASALVRFGIAERFLSERFWPGIWRGAGEFPEPPPGVWALLRDALRNAHTDADAPRWSEESFKTVTTNADTHPCLSERLRALGCLPPGAERGGFAPVPSPPPQTAAILLGIAQDTVRAALDAEWRKTIREDWRAIGARSGALRGRVRDIEQVAPAGNADALWDKACATAELHGPAAAEPLLRELLATRPDHRAGAIRLGQILLARGDAAGVAHLERAASGDEEVFPQVHAIAVEYFQRTGQPDRLREWNARLDQHEAAMRASREERSSVSGRDTFIFHGLAPAELAPVVRLLESDPDLASATLACKQLELFAHQRLFVLCLRGRRAWHGLGDGGRGDEIAARVALKIPLPGRVFAFGATGDFAAVARKIGRIAGSEIFRR
jgi:Zn-dependent protease with chaperone function